MIRLLAPSDLSYLFDRCPRCYWLKLHGVKGPDEILPGVFRDIDRAQKAGITLDAVRGLGIPATEFLPKDKVISAAHNWGGTDLAISGQTDRRVLLEDGTIGVLDFKTSGPRLHAQARFWRAMASYQYAIENPNTGEGREVSLLSIVAFTPLEFKLRAGSNTEAFYKGRLGRYDLEIDRPKYERMLEKVGTLLANPVMPKAGACDNCRHADTVAAMRVNDLLAAITNDPTLGPDIAAQVAALHL